MTRTAIARTHKLGADAGLELSAAVSEQLDGDRPDALVVFATPLQDHGALLEALLAGTGAETLIGCSSAGEFTNEESGFGMTCVVAFVAPQMRFTAAIGRGLRGDRAAAADAIFDELKGPSTHDYRHRSALIFTDALAGFADDLIDRLSDRTGGIYTFFGGGAGDDDRFKKTVVFHGKEVVSDGAVALEILSDSPIGVGVSHGWRPGGAEMRITEAEGMALRSLNAIPAAEVYDTHASATGQTFDRSNPVPFFLHNVLGVESPEGYRLRVPLAIQDDDSLTLAADVRTGSRACVMFSDAESAAAAAARATRSALDALEGAEPAFAFLFDCVATRLRLGHLFEAELAAVDQELGGLPFAGFNTYGQIAKTEGQFSGFHNCTAVVCVIPR